MREPKMCAVLLVRRAALPSSLPNVPEALAALPEVQTAFVSLYRRPPSEEEQRRVHLSSDREWLVVTMPEEREWLSTAEAAALLRCSEDQTRRYCESGLLDGDPARGVEGAWRPHVGAHWRIPRAAIEILRDRTRPKVRRS